MYAPALNRGAQVANISLEYRVPSADLQPFVTLFYHFRAEMPLFEDTERADHAQLRFRITGPDSTYGFPDESEQSGGPIHVIGPTSGAMRSRGSGPVLEIVGMGIQPAGWAAMLGIEASSLLNRVVDGGALFGEAVESALVAIRVGRTTEEKVAAAETFVRAAIAGSDSRTLDFARAIDAWLADADHLSPDVDALIATTGLSRRQIERRCNTLYGAPPKVLARKYRALRAAVALASGEATLDALLADGFYDQSHLIREVKHFTGLTPRQVQTEQSPLSRLTIEARKALEGQVHPIITET
jgi:AraC-like DNA-binding protein